MMPFSLTHIAYFLIALCIHVAASERFASHVTVNTPARSYSHGVGDPIAVLERRGYQYRPKYSSIPPRIPLNGGRRGYPRVRPAIPFNAEEFPYHRNSISTPQLRLHEVAIPVLPPSPYKVDSPDPESLWPEGLFLPPRFGLRHRIDDEVTSDSVDPYLLEGSEAIAAVTRAKAHGIFWFHDIPHIQSLLTNQETRIKNNLEPNKIGSIRHSWPFNRP